MTELTPICVISRDGRVYRSAHGVGDGRIAFVFHDTPGSATIRVVVGHSKTGSVPRAETAAAMLTESVAWSDVVASLSIREKTVLDRVRQFGDPEDWGQDYWLRCHETRSDLKP